MTTMIKNTAHAEERDLTNEIVAENLRHFMSAERWSGRRLAHELGLQPVYVQRRMSGEVELSVSDLKMFSDKLGAKVQDFFVPRTEPRPGGGARRRSLYLLDGVGPAGIEPTTSTV